MLCSTTNRVLLSGSPSTCALDTSITPIPAFLLITFLAIYVPTRFFLSRRAGISFSSNSTPRTSTSNNPDHNHKPPYNLYGYAPAPPSESQGESPARRPGLELKLKLKLNRGLLPKWLHWTYVALIVCLLGLRILEIVRLVLAEMGVGLLPVIMVADVICIVMLTCGGCSSCGMEMGKMRSRVISASLVVYWALSTILESIKVTRLASYNALHPAKDTAYPSSDWLLDNGCMLGLIVIFLIIEGTYLVLRCRSAYLPETPPVPVKERTISNPRPLSEYEIDPVLYLDERSGSGKGGV